MKIAAVIAEYNPFHKGHLYQLATLRNELGADKIIVVLSGDFVQRGAPAILDKYTRCRMALEHGADMVIELPVYFALGSAEYFAQGAVSLLDKLGIVDLLYFGSECGDIDLLMACAETLLEEPPAYQARLKQYLKQGFSFPHARSAAFSALFSDDARDKAPDYEKILAMPNNNLAVEYIKALLRRGSAIRPITLLRKDNGYASTELPSGCFASANAVRNALLTSGAPSDGLRAFLPESVFQYFETAPRCYLSVEDFSPLLHYKLLMQQPEGKNCFTPFYDVNEQLSNTLYNRLPDYSGFSGFALACKSRNLTYARISRCLMHILLDMKQDTVNALKERDYSPYARVLGFRESGRALFTLLKANAAIPIITRPSAARTQSDALAWESFLTDMTASNIYQSIRVRKMTSVSHNKKVCRIPNELTRQIIKLP
ncbi:MAG: nucleotidyltransferase family protein [Roseburia sp.]|nr:nucleotidyltransferase family protein [Roseburia sp.]